jgi:dimethylargininase
MLTAITRPISPGIGNCELTHLERQSIDSRTGRTAARAVRASALEAAGCRVVACRPIPTCPIRCSSKTSQWCWMSSRSLPVLARFRGGRRRLPLCRRWSPTGERVYILEPGTIDGGDVLLVGSHHVHGVTARSNDVAVQQMPRS